jgi:DNA-binding FadR family transcriptional regulator
VTVAEDNGASGPARPGGTAARTLGRQVRAPKMAEMVASQLRRRIITGELAEGDSLPSEATLVAQFGVSRPTLREAFRVLESESLITIRRGAHGGGRVMVPDRVVAARYTGLILEYGGTTVEDVYDARVELEAPCAAALARSRTDLDLADLRSALRRHEAMRTDYAEKIRAHVEFHGLLVRLAGNKTMTMLSQLMEHIIATANISQTVNRDKSNMAERVDRSAARSHRRVIELIERGDADAAEGFWREHLVRAEEYVLRGQHTRTVLDLLSAEVY